MVSRRPLTLKSCLKMADAAVLKRSYDDAPVSSLYYGGRKQDLAFEQAVGESPRHRHHVRFWRLGRVDADGRPVWVGSAVYDERVGLSRTTGEVTHFTAPDVDAEREYLFHDLERTGNLASSTPWTGFIRPARGATAAVTPGARTGSSMSASLPRRPRPNRGAAGGDAAACRCDNVVRR